jgi:hypothetical protein
MGLGSAVVAAGLAGGPIDGWSGEGLGAGEQAVRCLLGGFSIDRFWDVLGGGFVHVGW